MTILKNIQENSTSFDPKVPQPLTEDSLLDGRVRFFQPKDGFRVAMDSVFLSAAVQAEPNQTVLDVGAGVGAASLCLATRLPYIRVIGVELQREYVRLSFDNAKINNLNHRVEVLQGDLLRPPPRLAASTYDHVMANPPYHGADHHASPNNSKATANHEGTVGLEQWIKFCLLMAKPKGMITLVHKMDRLDEVLYYSYGKMGCIRIFPLWAGDKKEAKRFILQGIKAVQGPTHLLPGMILHKSDGRYTDDAEDVLRHAKGIVF
ncbi:MAG: methyltransferase [Proteobacteria bacterium]|nr:methyltransferase [Pseudomonadota bacterium]